MSDEVINRFLDAIQEIFSGMDVRAAWPLNGGQMDSYFDVDEALDMYYRLKKLRGELSVEEIAKLMPSADVIRLFLEHNAIIGLKVSNKLNIHKISIEDRLEYVLFLFEILKRKVKNDIFCLDGKNILLSDDELHKILFETNWNFPNNADEKKEISFLTVMANNLCYTLFYDAYMAGGFYIHGPYDSCEKFGENSILLVRDYHNIAPVELWGGLDFPYKSMKILAIYKNLDIKINFANHPISKSSVGDKLIAYKIFLDDKELEFDKVNGVIALFQKIISHQTKKINALHDLDKVRKGAEISFYLFKNLRSYMRDSWKPPKEIEKTIEKFQDQFIKKFKYKEKPSLEHWRKLFDPRNDYF